MGHYTLRQNENASLTNLSDIVLERNGMVVASNPVVDGRDLTFSVNDTILDGQLGTYYIKAIINNVDQTTDKYEFEVRNTSDVNIVEGSTSFRATVAFSDLVDFGKLDIEWLEKLYSIVSIAKDIVWIVAILLCVSVVLIIGNTIRLNILSQRDEIVVMKLVGATDNFIRFPFLYTGFWYGFLGGMLAWMLVAFLLWWIQTGVENLAGLYQTEFTITGLDMVALGIILAISISLGLIGSIISVQKHIKEIEPK